MAVLSGAALERHLYLTASETVQPQVGLVGQQRHTPVQALGQALPVFLEYPIVVGAGRIGLRGIDHDLQLDAAQALVAGEVAGALAPANPNRGRVHGVLSRFPGAVVRAPLPTYPGHAETSGTRSVGPHQTTLPARGPEGYGAA